jgi:excisionase family DNA binding protein
MTATTRSKYLSKAEAADYLGISERSLRRLYQPDHRTGKVKLPTYKPVPGRTVLKQDDLDAYMETCRAEAQA